MDEWWNCSPNASHTVLVVAPADFVPTSTADLCGVRDAAWHEQSLAVFGLSGDSLFSHAAYAGMYDIPFPLVTDFHGQIAESYGSLANAWEGHRQIPKRAAIVIDEGWTIVCHETVTEPLEQTSNPPVEKAGETLQELGFHVSVPTVRCDY